MVASSGTNSAAAIVVAKRSLEERVALIEAQFGGKTLAEHFREQAELIDRRFLLVDPRFHQIDEQLHSLASDLAVVRRGIEVLLSRKG